MEVNIGALLYVHNNKPGTIEWYLLVHETWALLMTYCELLLLNAAMLKNMYRKK